MSENSLSTFDFTVQLTPIANRMIFFCSADCTAFSNSFLSWDTPSVMTIKYFFANDREPRPWVKMLSLSKQERYNFKIIFLPTFCQQFTVHCMLSRTVNEIAHLFFFNRMTLFKLSLLWLYHALVSHHHLHHMFDGPRCVSSSPLLKYSIDLILPICRWECIEVVLHIGCRWELDNSKLQKEEKFWYKINS